MKPIEEYGYDAVGPGWKFILEALDLLLAQSEMSARVNAVALPQYRDEGNSEEAKVKVEQVKEKFGGLRVYLNCIGMAQGFSDEAHGAVMMAERMAAIHCEMCGSRDKVVNRGANNQRRSWTKTLCGACHAKRDAGSQPHNGEWRDPV